MAEPVPKARRSSEAAERQGGAEVCGTNIDYLPDELMIHIFSYFGVNELMDILQNVCVRWKRLVHVPALWLDKQFVIGKCRTWYDCCLVPISKCPHCRFAVEDEEIVRTAATMPQLRQLTILRNIEHRVLREICTNWPNLTDLHMNCYQDMNYSLMEHIFQKCPKIERLRTGANLLTFQQSVELLSSLEHLKSVQVSTYVEARGPVRLRVLADGCPHLEAVTLYCRYDELEVNDMEYFFRTTKHSLTSAYLPWMMKGMTCVAPLLKQCDTSLRTLMLVTTGELPEQQAAAFGALGELHSVQMLVLNIINSCQPKVVSHAFRPGCLTQLRQLALSVRPNMDDETLITISRGCTKLSYLRILSARNISDLALSEIYRLRHLKILVLSECDGLGGAAVAHLARLPALHTLVLRHFSDLTKLQPSLQQIVDMKELKCLDLVKSRHNTAVPFDEFPGRLVKLRVLHVTYDGENKSLDAEPEHNMPETFFSELQRKMPLLRVFNTRSNWW